jgi:hypothetical protein
VNLRGVQKLAFAVTLHREVTLKKSLVLEGLSNHA